MLRPLLVTLGTLLGLITLGCATGRRPAGPPPPDIICTSAEDCEVAWGRAVLWISQNCHWKIRNQSDVLITTEGPFDEPYPAYQVNKVALGGGRYQIVFGGGCGNIFGCVPTIPEAQADFSVFVGARASASSPPPAQDVPPKADPRTAFELCDRGIQRFCDQILEEKLERPDDELPPGDPPLKE